MKVYYIVFIFISRIVLIVIPTDLVNLPWKSQENKIVENITGY